MKFLKKTVAGVLLCGSASLFGLELTNDINLSGGYQHDYIKIKDEIVFPTDFIHNGNEIEAVRRELKADDINIGVVGLDFRLVMPQMDCCWEYPFLNNFYIDGSAYWGWSGRDHYKRDISLRGPTALISSFDRHGRIKDGRFEDFEISLGYLVYNCDCWAVGIFGGYSYDRQRLKFRDRYDGDADFDDIFTGGKLTQRWNSGNLGAEIFYDWCEWMFNVGYAYHWAHYDADRRFDPYTGISYTEKRKSHKANGNEVYVNAHYQLCDCWEVGLGYTFRDFEARHVKVRADFDRVGLPADTRARSKADWTSHTIVADVGYQF